MKKLLSILILVLYTLGSAGAIVQWHYCMGRLQQAELGHNDHHVCGKCGMDAADGSMNNCCKTEITSFKIDDDHASAASFCLPPAVLPAEVVVWSPKDQRFSGLTGFEWGTEDRGPPLWVKRTAAFLCTFRC